MERLLDLVGSERDLDENGRAIYAFASALRAPTVGALLVTCADECERECADAFQRNVAEYLLPDLKFGSRSPLRISNLGGRYEQGAIGIADDHFSTEVARKKFKLMLVKINSHVCTEPRPGRPRFGSMRRYDAESSYCGALHALLDGSAADFARDLQRTFSSGGQDRLATLLDPSRVAIEDRALFAALTNARLQAERAMEDIRELTQHGPTLFIVLSCVTVNRRTKDTEIVCGVDVADRRTDPPEESSRNLGDDPARYRLRHHAGRWMIESV